MEQQRTALQQARAAALDRAGQLDHMTRVLETVVPSPARIAAETAQWNVMI